MHMVWLDKTMSEWVCLQIKLRHRCRTGAGSVHLALWLDFLPVGQFSIKGFFIQLVVFQQQAIVITVTLCRNA